MIILDTNVISALMRSPVETRIVDWLDSLPTESIWTTSICVFEISYGLECLPKGRRRTMLQEAFERFLRGDFKGRVLDFDSVASHAAALIAARLRAKGRPVEIRDVMIAGIVAAKRGAFATRNTKHFVDTEVQLVNPWDDVLS